MTKVLHAILLLSCLTSWCYTTRAQAYRASYHQVDPGADTLPSFKNQFETRGAVIAFLPSVLSQLQSCGYLGASIDSMAWTHDTAVVYIFLGTRYPEINIKVSESDAVVLRKAGWVDNTIATNELDSLKSKLLDIIADDGHPFASVSLANIRIDNNGIDADLVIDRGPAYVIDSLRVYGDVPLRKDYLSRYLHIPNRSPYRKQLIAGISDRLAQLSFIKESRPPDVQFTGTGAVVNLYLEAVPANNVQALVGFLPATDVRLTRKLLLAVDANVHLANAFGSGETLSLVWQQLQRRSPRLDLRFEYPFVFRSPFSLQTAFDMFRQDSSFLNINFTAGAFWQAGNRAGGSLFLQHQKTIVNGVDTLAVLRQRRLPEDVDVSSLNLGMTWQHDRTDYRPAPRRGSFITITGAGGRKSFRKNQAVLNLKDPADPSFSFARLYDSLPGSAAQLRISGKLQQYLPLGKQTSLLLALNGGWYYSPVYFRNELFRIGGYRLLRGFNDESQYVSRYAVATAELRYYIARRSAFFAFSDAGAGRHEIEATPLHYYLSGGLGLSFETRAGIMQLAWALGKRDDTAIDWKQSKIHIGFTSYF